MNWSAEQSQDLYGISRWGNGYFSINDEGEVVVNLKDGEKNVPVSLEKIIQGLKERGQALPQLLRFRDLVDDRIQSLNETFRESMEAIGYQGEYRGVYPIKVSQQQQVIEEITEFGDQYHYGMPQQPGTHRY